MHSRKKGRSGSKKPHRGVPSWVRYKPAEVEKLIVKLAKAGNSPSMIGMTLRDSYGIPDTKDIAKKKINQILKENKAEKKLPEDILALVKKDIKLVKHLDMHKKDQTVWRGLNLTESKINKLARYYKREGVLAADWKFDRKSAKMLIE